MLSAKLRNLIMALTAAIGIVLVAFGVLSQEEGDQLSSLIGELLLGANGLFVIVEKIIKLFE